VGTITNATRTVETAVSIADPHVIASVLFIERMAMSADRLGCVDEAQVGIAPLQVLRHGHDLHVPGIHARAVPAQVVDLETRGDGISEKAIGDPMSVVLLHEVHRAIAISIQSSRPWPASF